MRPATRITAPTVIHGNPSPRVGRRLPAPPPAVATLGRVEVVLEGAEEDVVGVGGVTGWPGEAEAATRRSPSVSSPKATARRMRRKVQQLGERGVG